MKCGHRGSDITCDFAARFYYRVWDGGGCSILEASENVAGCLSRALESILPQGARVFVRLLNQQCFHGFVQVVDALDVTVVYLPHPCLIAIHKPAIRHPAYAVINRRFLLR